MSTASLNGAAVTSCTVQIPAVGLWWADVEAETTDPILSGAATLVLADATFVGHIIAGGEYQGPGTARTRYRMVAGHGGWSKSIRAKSYRNDIGIKTALAVMDAATEVGEVTGALPSDTLGERFVRQAGRAARVLDAVAPQAWYVDSAGVTQCGRRSAVAYTGAATRTNINTATGRVDLAPLEILPLMPGAIVEGIEAIDVEHTLTEAGLRTTIWGAGVADGSRLPDALRTIVEAFTASHRFYAPWEYRVVQAIGSLLDLQVVRSSSDMPDILGCRVRPGIAGLRAMPRLGSKVLVAFANGDPSRPLVVSGDDCDAPGFVPLELFVQAGVTGIDAGCTEHATSAEALVIFVYQLLAQVAMPLGGGAVVAAAIGSALAAMPTASFDAIDGAASIPVGTTKAAFLGLLATKTPNTTGSIPNVGWPKVRGG